MTDPVAVRAMLEARTIAVVGASPRTDSFGYRLVTEVTRSPSAPAVHLVNPRHAEVLGRPCLPSLAEVPGPVDLVLLGVGDHAVEKQLEVAAGRGARAAVVFGNAYEEPDPERPSLRRRLATLATDAGMALCGAGCMGFVNLAYGLRAIGYLERESLPAGEVALVSHSGSAFSALLRSRRRFGFTLTVSSGQELVTTTADYLEYALDRPETGVVALLLETLREPMRVRSSLVRAAERGVPVVLLAVGGTPAGRAMVEAHSGALAGDDATWEALVEAHSVLRVADLDEMADTLELLCSGRRATGGPGTGLATVHDSGAERTLVADLAAQHRVPLADLGQPTLARLAGLLDPGLTPANPLDVWGNGARTQELFTGCLQAMADDPAVGAVAFGVDLVPEYDGDDSFPLAILDVAGGTTKPVVVLANLVSAIDQEWASTLRERGVPVLEGTRSGLRALGHLMRLGARPGPLTSETLRPPGPGSSPRAERWRRRLAEGPLSGEDGFALLAEYGVPTTPVASVHDAGEAVAAATRLGWPVVLKTDEPTVAHKSDVGGVVLGLRDPAALRSAYEDLRTRLGPRALVCATAPRGVELVLGVHRDPLLGPLLVAGAGGVLAELLDDRAVALPPLDEDRADAMLERLAVRRLLAGERGAAPADRAGVVQAMCAVAQIALELGCDVDGLDVNPLIAHLGGVVAVDVLVVPRVGEPG
ncbi:MAG: acetate--CoA ligase family protein [Actinomycetes bacterium]